MVICLKINFVSLFDYVLFFMSSNSKNCNESCMGCMELIFFCFGKCSVIRMISLSQRDSLSEYKEPEVTKVHWHRTRAHDQHLQLIAAIKIIRVARLLDRW